MRRIVLIVFGFAGVLAFVPGVASAASGWGTATSLSTDNCRTYYPTVVAVGAADAVGMWMRDGTCGVAPPYVEQTASLSENAWSDAVTLTNGESASPPSLAADGLGNVWAVWSEFDGAAQRIDLVVARRSASGVWGTPTVLDSSGNSSARGAFLDANAAGSVAVLWSKQVGSDVIATVYRYSPASDWDTGAGLSASGSDVVGSRIALDDAGGAIATWSRITAVNQSQIPTALQLQARISGADGAWGPTTDLTSVDGYALSAPLERTPDGRIGIVTAIVRETGRNTLVAFRHDGSSWGTGVTLSGDDEVNQDGDGGYPTLSLIADGRAIVSWLDVRNVNANEIRVRVARAEASGAWQGAEAIGSPGAYDVGQRVVLDPVGNAFAMWVRGDPISGATALVARRSPATGGWSDVAIPRGVGTKHSAFDLAVSASGAIRGLFQDNTVDGVWERIYGASWTPPTPRRTERPRIRGTVRVGKTLRVTDGSWTEVATVEHRWQRCPDGIRYRCRTIPGAVGSTYRVTDADRGSSLRVVSRATGIGGTSGYVATAMTRTFSKLTIRRLAVGRNGVRVRVRVSGAGRIDVRGTIGATRRPACARVVRVKRAAFATLTCRLRPGVRARLVGRSPVLRVAVTYRPTRGVARRVIRTVEVGPITPVR